MIQMVALMGVFGFGIVCSIIGALKLELARGLNIDDARVGGLISALMSSCVLVVLVVGLLIDLFGHKPLAIAGFLIGSIALFLLVAARSYREALIACILLGVGGQCINVVGSTLLPLTLFGGRNAPAAMNLGTAFYGLGAFVTPFLTGILLKRIGYRATGNLIALIFLAPVFLALLASYPPVISGFSFHQVLGLLANGLIVTAGMTLFCGVGLQVSMGTWITTYGNSVGFSVRSSSLILSLFWISFMVGRLLASSIVNPETGARVIAVLAIIACIPIGLMVRFKSKAAAFGYIITGLAIGPILPTTVGITFAQTAEAIHGTVFGVIFAFGFFGGSTIPAAIGIYSRKKTIHKSLKIAIGAALVVFLMALVLDRFYRPKG